MTESDAPNNDRHYMGKFMPSIPGFYGAIDGRYVISNTHNDITIVDLFHSKTTKLRLDLSLATIDGVSSHHESCLWINRVFALDLYTMIVWFEGGYPHGLYLGVARPDFERSVMIVQQTIRLSTDRIKFFSWFPKSYPPNLHEGFILWMSEDSSEQGEYFLLNMKTDNQLRTSRIDVPAKMEPFGCFNGFLYGMTVGLSGNPGDVNRPRPIDLVKVSLSNGDYVQKRTSNYEIAERLNLPRARRLPDGMCLIGKTLFVYNYCAQNEKARTVSLDLDTLEWKSGMISSNSVRPIGTDGERALILTKRFDGTLVPVYRYVFNEPDKLSDLAWLRLKRLFDARPSAYEYILSQLPANFKPKCPFPQS